MPGRKAKVVFVLIDGLSDVSLSALSQKTPLETADVPTFDSVAKYGLNGLLDPVEPGLACGSDTAHLSILGYDPREYYRGRGSFESMGAGIDMIPGDIAFKSNFATLDPTTNIVLKRRADRNFEVLGPRLCADLNGLEIPGFAEYEVQVKYATEHRCGVLLRGPNLTEKITGTDPLKDNKPLLPCQPLSSSDQDAVHTCKVVNALNQAIQKALTHHKVNDERIKSGLNPANVILLRGAGVRIKVPLFDELQNVKSFVIAPTCIIAGLAMSLGMHVLKVEGATGDYHTDFSKKADACCKHIVKDEFDFGFVHIKAVDDAGHDGQPELKVQFLQKVDAMVASIRDQLKPFTDDMDFTIVITGDHSTTCCSLDHSYEPVAFTICKLDHMLSESKKWADCVQQFSEIEAGKGALGRFPGAEVMGIIKRFAYS